MEHHFDIDIAKEYGMAEAVLINHFQYWIAKNKANMVNFHDGKFWTYNTKSAIQELFPYLSYDQVRRALERLVEKGVLVTGNYNKIPTDRTLWYSFTDEFECYLQKRPIELAEMPNAKGKTNQPIPYNSTTYNTPNNPTLFNNKDSVISPTTSKRVKSYSRPTLEEVAAYCEERNNGIDPQYFLDYQNARGWLIGGKTPVKDWKAAIRTWESKNKRDNRPLDVRRDEFYDKVNAFLRTPEYAGEKELLYGFYNYWAQEKDGRMLWEMQPAFDIERRLRIEKTKRKN